MPRPTRTSSRHRCKCLPTPGEVPAEAPRYFRPYTERRGACKNDPDWQGRDRTPCQLDSRIVRISFPVHVANTMCADVLSSSAAPDEYGVVVFCIHANFTFQAAILGR